MLKLLRVLCAALALVAAAPVVAEPPKKPDLVEVIEISGEINQVMADMIAKQVEAINENPKVKAVLLVVESPGGGAIASAALYEEISKLKAPVVGWCGYVCASGGYYVLMATSVKHIGIRSETITGSVGVIMQVTRFSRLLEFLKIDSETYVSGSLKDAGNAARPAREDEKKYLQTILDNLAARFYEVVARSRPIKDWPAVKTGRIFIGVSAVERGLVDSIMSKEAAIKKAKELSKSELIFTREEIRKMSKMAEEPSSMQHTVPQPHALGDLPWLIETLKEIRAAETVKFEYRMPYKF